MRLYTSLKNLGAVNNVEVAEKVDVFAPTIQTVNEEGVSNPDLVIIRNTHCG
jgi:hypothetical protein